MFWNSPTKLEDNPSTLVTSKAQSSITINFLNPSVAGLLSQEDVFGNEV